MSIQSAVYADAAEKKRKEWLRKLRIARTFRSWILVASLIKDMEEFYFSE